MIQQFAAAAAYPTLCDSILPGTFEPGADRTHHEGSNRCGDFQSILGITIKDDESRSRSKWKCFSQLLDDPQACRMLCDVEVQDAPTIVADDQGFYFVAFEPGHKLRTYLMRLNSGKAEPVTPEGYAGAILSPDGKRLVVRDPEGHLFLFDLEKGQLKPLKGVQLGERCLNWDEKGSGIYLTSSDAYPVQIDHVSVSTGARVAWRTLQAVDPAGVGAVYVAMPRSGEPIVHANLKYLSELYLVEGLH